LIEDNLALVQDNLAFVADNLGLVEHTFTVAFDTELAATFG